MRGIGTSALATPGRHARNLESVQTRRKKTAVIASIAAALLGAGLYWFVYLGVPLYDEWHCSKGHRPVTFDDGGSTCVSNGSAIPADGTVDPLGNRPFSCANRRGWTVIYRGETEDCLRDGLDMPEGWSQGKSRR